jgi:hypothetical protein
MGLNKKFKNVFLVYHDDCKILNNNFVSRVI